ncbi:flagellar motor switch protein FliG [Jiella sp. MQZ9-1]|uniref:Flagellar motor switch protein FliG n=1 Tax=Jiella flava TaxID=2816857 RepID=A0A939FVJ7_9HYPH|nr:FliG C-terminal domain-containing protein [Jiella flava]MBO0660955.1 flagellar motor switch protein FliG [Jiella flava]MCD2469603.1 flagellar motor switch protein FliG [Jiella flava]
MSIVASFSDESSLPESGSARAAILLLALGAEGAGRLLKHLSPEEIRVLRASAAALSTVGPEQIDEVVDEFQSYFKRGAALTGPGKEMAELLESALSREQYISIFDPDSQDTALADLVEINGDGNVWEAVAGVEPTKLAEKLLPEHPQMVAIILARVQPETASQIVRVFEPAMRNDIMTRILTLKPLPQTVQSVLETQIRRHFLVGSGDAEEGGSHAFLAEIVNRLDKDSSDAVLESLRANRPKDAEALEKLLFAFDDLPSLPLKSRLTLFDAVAPDVLIRALRGATGDIIELVLSSLGARARRMAEAELKQEATVQKAEIEAAKRDIAKTALRLAGEGKLALREQPDDED